MAAERVEAVLEHITYTKGVIGAVVCTTDGEPIRDSFQSLDRTTATAYATMAGELAQQAALIFKASAEGASESSAKHSKTADALPIQQSSLELLRVRTKQHEIIVKCSEEFLVVVVQEPTD